MILKNELYTTRIDKGNLITELNFKYLAQRFRIDIGNFSGTFADIKMGQDGEVVGWKKTLQAKSRDSKYGDDILQEVLLILPEPLSTKLLPTPPYKIKEGRDMHGFSDYTICMPANKDRIVLVETFKLHQVVYDVMEEWLKTDEEVRNVVELMPFEAKNGKKCKIVRAADGIFYNWIKWAYYSSSKAYCLFTSNNVVAVGRPAQIWCNIDTVASNPYKAHAKLIVYIPWRFFNKYVSVVFREGEVWNDPETWFSFQGEDIRNLLI